MNDRPTPSRKARPRTGASSDTRRGRNGWDGSRPRHVQSLLNAVDTLWAIARSGPELGVSELARRTGMSKAATYAILRTLESQRLVARDPQAHTYRLGWALYELGLGVVRSLDLSRAARSHLDYLAEQTRDSVLLGIVEGDSILYLDRGESPDQFHMTANIGRRSPLHASATGKAIIAFWDQGQIEELLAGELKAHTVHTITDRAAVQEELAAVRELGYATCWQEVEIGLSSIGVPVRDYTGHVVAGLTLAGPVARVNADKLAELVPLIKATGAAIEERLGASSSSLNPLGKSEDDDA